MSRFDVPNQGPSLKVVDAMTKRIGFSIQNPSAVDIYYSEDQRTLDSVSAANLPTVGTLLAATTPVSPPIVYPKFFGQQIFVRAQSAGAKVEVLIYDIDVPCTK